MRYNYTEGTRLERLRELLLRTSILPDHVYKTIQAAEMDADKGARLCDTLWNNNGLSSTIRKCIAGTVGYALADTLNLDDEARKKFYQAPFWTGRTYVFNNDNLLSYALMRMHGSHTGPIAAQAQREARAMQGCFEQGVPAIDVFEQLVRCGGFAGMLARSKAVIDEMEDQGSLNTKARTKGIKDRASISEDEAYRDDDVEEVPASDAHKNFIKVTVKPNRYRELKFVRHGMGISAELERIRSDDGTLCFALRSFDER